MMPALPRPRLRGVGLALVAVLLVLPSVLAARPWVDPDAELSTPNGCPPLGVEGEPVAAPADGVGPGSKLLITGPSWSTACAPLECTASFLWTDGERYFLTTAGHCVIDGGEVRVCTADCHLGGASGQHLSGDLRPLGELLFVRNDGEGADVAFVEVPRDLWGHLRFEVPVWGGPTHVACPVFENDDMPDAHVALTYGQSYVFGETHASQARAGHYGGCFESRGTFRVAIPGTYADSGSPMLLTDEDATQGMRGGAALGIHTHGPGIRTGTTVARAEFMAENATGLDLHMLCAGGVWCT